MPAGFPKSRGRFDNCVISVLWAPGTADVSVAPWPKTALPEADSRVRPQSGQRCNLPSFPHKPQHLYRAGLVARGAELLSHTIVFWAFCTALDYFGREITMEGCGPPAQGPPGTAGSPQSRGAFVWGRPRGGHTAPRLQNAACCNISSQFTAATWGRGGLQYRRKVTSPAFLCMAVLR